MLIQHINFLIWFKVCRPIKRNYNLSTNCCLILIAAHTLQQVNSKGFTLRNLRIFAPYYSPYKIKSYIKVLVDRSFITQSGVYNSHQLYCVSPIGLTVISELNDSYNKELVLFCSKYNIEL